MREYNFFIFIKVKNSGKSKTTNFFTPFHSLFTLLNLPRRRPAAPPTLRRYSPYMGPLQSVANSYYIPRLAINPTTQTSFFVDWLQYQYVLARIPILRVLNHGDTWSWVEYLYLAMFLIIYQFCSWFMAHVDETIVSYTISVKSCVKIFLEFSFEKILVMQIVRCCILYIWRCWVNLLIWFRLIASND